MLLIEVRKDEAWRRFNACVSCTDAEVWKPAQGNIRADLSTSGFEELSSQLVLRVIPTALFDGSRSTAGISHLLLYDPLLEC